MRSLKALAAALTFTWLTPQVQGKPPIVVPESPLTYADTADLSLGAEIVAEVQILKLTRVDSKKLPAPTGSRRYLVNAKVIALIRGKQGLAPSISYVVEIKSDSLGRFPNLKKALMIVFAVPVASRSDEIQLIAPDAQQPLSPALGTRVRAILAEFLAPAPAPRILRVGDAFHVPGAVPGESETQIFLVAEDGRPLSLSIWREQGQTPHWSVSVGEIVDESAGSPKLNTLLWYRLACFLPPALPAASMDSLDADSAHLAAEDYTTVIRSLGACPRTR
jgi:hypothetical protein